MGVRADDCNALPGADSLLHTLQRLWPDGEVRVTRRRSLRAGPVASFAAAITTPTTEMLCVPNARAPRLLVPAERPAAARALQRFSDALGAGELARRLASGAAVRLAAGALLPDRVTVSGGGVAEHLADVLGEPVTTSLGIGSARANRKPVLGVFDRRGRQIAFVKVGDNDMARGLVTHEAAALARLGEHRFEHLTAPQLIALSEWNGLLLLVMTALPTAARFRRSVTRLQPPTDAMDELATAFPAGDQALAECASWRRCEAACRELDDAAAAERYAAALRAIATRWGAELVPIGAWHGDFTPWNLSRHRGTLHLWDWERFEEGVPVGFDRVHWAMQVDPDARHCRLDAIAAALSAFPPALAAAYLAAFVGRYLLAAERHQGDLIAPQAMSALAALGTLSD